MAHSKKHYLQLEFSSGSLYEYSKRRKEDFEEYDNGWRLYYDEGISGELQSISLRDNLFLERQEISIALKDDDGEYFYIPIPLEDTKGNIGTYAESLISFLANLDKGEYYTIRAYNFKPDDSKYKKIGISIKDEDDEKIKKALTFSYIDKKTGEIVEGDIPALEWETKRGKNRPTPESLDEKNDFLWDVLQDELDRLGYKRNSEEEEEDTPRRKSARGKKNTEEEERTPRTKRRSSRKVKDEEEEEEEETPRRSRRRASSTKKTTSRRRNRDEEEEEEEEETPKRSSRRKPVVKKKAISRRRRNEEEEEEEETPRRSRRRASSKKKAVDTDEKEDWEDDLPF